MFNINKAGTRIQYDGKDKTKIRNLEKLSVSIGPLNKKGAIFKSHFNFIAIYYVLTLTRKSSTTLS